MATLSHLADGRFVFGVGAGWLVEELRNHGVDPASRWQKLTEQIEALREIWTRDPAQYHGQFVDFDPIWLAPKPVPLPPILIGGSSRKALHAAATYGDGWIPVIDDSAALREGLSLLHDLCEQAERPPPQVTVCLFGLDAGLLKTCADLGVQRCAVLAPTADRGELVSFLDACAQAASAFE